MSFYTFTKFNLKLKNQNPLVNIKTYIPNSELNDYYYFTKKTYIKIIPINIVLRQYDIISQSKYLEQIMSSKLIDN